MKTLSLVAVMAVVVMLCGGCGDGETVSGEAECDSLPMLVAQVKKCSQLYTAECSVRKIVTYDDIMRLHGNMFSRDFNIALPIGDRKIAIPIEATLKAYLDFSGFSERNVQRNGDKLTIILPDPKVVLTSSKVDHEGTKEYVSLVRSHFTDAEMGELERQGRQAIIESSAQMGIVETARESAARVLIPMLALMGYDKENITVTFRNGFRPDDIGALIDNTTIEQ